VNPVNTGGEVISKLQNSNPVNYLQYYSKIAMICNKILSHTQLPLRNVEKKIGSDIVVVSFFDNQLHHVIFDQFHAEQSCKRCDSGCSKVCRSRLCM